MAEKMYTLLQKEQQSDLQDLEDEYEFWHLFHWHAVLTNI